MWFVGVPGMEAPSVWHITNARTHRGMPEVPIRPEDTSVGDRLARRRGDQRALLSATALVVVVSCSTPQPSSDTRTTDSHLAVLGAVCNGGTQAVRPVATRPVNLGPSAGGGSRELAGPRVTAVVRNADEWARVWHDALEGLVPPPALPDTSYPFLFVATESFPVGPVGVEIPAVVECERSGEVLGSYRLTGPSGAGRDGNDRGFVAVQVVDPALRHRPTRIVDPQ